MSRLTNLRAIDRVVDLSDLRAHLRPFYSDIGRPSIDPELMIRMLIAKDRQQVTPLPDCLDDYIGADNPVRLIEVFVDDLDLTALGFASAVPRRRAGPPTIRRRCSSSISTAISTASRRAVVSNARASATSS